jgi:hypothetical protein
MFASNDILLSFEYAREQNIRSFCIVFVRTQMPAAKAKPMCPYLPVYGMCLRKVCHCLHLSIVQDECIGDLSMYVCPFKDARGGCPFGTRCRRSHAKQPRLTATTDTPIAAAT